MILAASGIILNDKRILLLQRSDYTVNYPGHWGCPGGRAEPGETAEQNVIREVKEECNLDFRPTQIFKTGIWQDHEFYRFLGDWSGNIVLQEEEVVSHGWFTFDEAVKLSFSFDYLDVVQRLRQHGYL
jgi:8-oxo-dGTP pyrophosphatase MutT (NUDIX family)